MQKLNYYKRDSSRYHFHSRRIPYLLLQNFQKAYALNIRKTRVGPCPYTVAYEFAKKEDSARMMLDLAVDLDPNNMGGHGEL